MKETIYTIPINDAFSQDTECPLCEFIKKEEKDRIEYALGASMMEPDARVLSNQKGYCQRHTAMMYSFGNKLSHALVLETRLKYISDEIENLKLQFKPKKRKGFLKKSKNEFKKTDLSSHTCVVCDRLEHVFNAFMKNLFYMYRTDNEFKEKIFSSKGFCLSHFDDLICYGNKYLPQDDFNDFVVKLCDLQKSNIDRVYEDVNWFTKKFDYRYKDEDWKNSKDAVPRACTKISGYLDEE